MAPKYSMFLVAVLRSQIKTEPSPDWSPLEGIYSIFLFNEHPELFIWEYPVGSSCLHVHGFSDSFNNSSSLFKVIITHCDHAVWKSDLS